MKKKCQIHAVTPITCFEVPIVGNTELNLTTEEIYKCLCAKAEITEILPNGVSVNLDFGNYDKDNTIKKEVKDIKEPTAVKVDIKEEVKETVTEVSEEPVEEVVEATEEVVEPVEEATEEVEEAAEEVKLEDKVEVKETTKKYEAPSRPTNYNQKNKNNRKNNR